MKHGIAVLLFLLLALAVPVPAQTKRNGPAQGTGATAQVLIALENKWVDALMKSDTAALDSIFADTYVDTDEHSQRSDKQGLLSVLKSGDLKMESIKLSDMHVQAYGDAAVVIGTSAQIGNFKGRPLAPKIIFTDTFIKQNGKWRAVASHRSLAA
jgi:ketosteroid isomerase-like protein